MNTLKGAHIAIVGLGLTFSDFLLARMRGEKFDEVWAINSMGGIIQHERMFMMDPASRFLDGENAGSQTEIMKEILLSHPGPIYTCELDKRCTNLVEYPLQQVIETTNLAYLNNTVAYALALAVAEEVENLSLFGIDFSYKNAPHFAEAGRACCEFWAATAIARGVKIKVAHNSPFLDTNVPSEEKLYGYHRLTDPYSLQSVDNGVLEITKASKLDPPEPLDAENQYLDKDCFVWGRNDLEKVSYLDEKKIQNA